MVTTAARSSQRVILQNISWQTFESILAEIGDHRANRLAYDEGMLEIIAPSMHHEHTIRVIDYKKGRGQRADARR
ncbi:MAG: hypothetical protein ACR2LR_18860 [Hassallia sp.]